MKRIFSELPGLLAHWEDQRREYDPSFYVLLLCGSTSALDDAVFSFVAKHPYELADMSGPYASFTVLARPVETSVTPVEIDTTSRHELQYLHAATPWALGAPGVYGLAQALRVPLVALPACIVSADPWSEDPGLVVALGDQRSSDADLSERTRVFFLELFGACRDASELQPEQRVRRLHQELVRRRIDFRAAAQATVESGALSQMIEALIRVLRSSGLLP